MADNNIEDTNPEDRYVSSKEDRDPEHTIDSPSQVPRFILPTYDLRMAALAWSFPSLSDAEGLHPWQPDRFERWLTFNAPSIEALHAGRFVLSLWNPNHHWTPGPFSIHDALACWDLQHRGAFISWVAAPWWP